MLFDWAILARALSMNLQHGLNWQFIIQVVFPTPFPLFPLFIQCDWGLLPFSAWGLMAGLHDLPWSLLSSLCHPCTHHCAIPSPITVPCLPSSLFHPCSYYFAIPALITLPSLLSSIMQGSMLPSLCHPLSHHCGPGPCSHHCGPGPCSHHCVIPTPITVPFLPVIS